MSENVKTRICTKCGKALPLTPEFFYRNSRDAEGFRRDCKACQQKQYKEYYNDKHGDEIRARQEEEERLRRANLKICGRCKRELPATSKYFYACSSHKSGFSAFCIECDKIAKEEYREQNRELILQRQRAQRLLVKDTPEFKARQKAADDKRKNDPARIAYRKKYYQEHREQIAAYQRKYNEEHKEIIAARNKRFREEHGDQIREWDRQRHARNRFARVFSMGICHALAGNKQERHWETLVPYTYEELKEYIESLFTPEMNWDNYGEYWELDHIIPQGTFSFTSEQDHDFKICWSLLNLRPLEVSLNRKRPRDGSDISKEIWDIIMNQEV